MNLFIKSSANKPKKIWLVRSYNTNTGEQFSERAFNYKCEAKQYCDYLINTDIEAVYYEVMLY